MRGLFLCGVFSDEHEPEIVAMSKRTIEYSANVFQKKLIDGFQRNSFALEVLSAPFIGSYPNVSAIAQFKGFSIKADQYHYVNFNNIWGIRNISRAQALKKAVIPFANSKEDGKIIFVYSPHTPFLEAAVYAKRLDSTIKICLILPDLPQYMNLNAKISAIYKLGKKYDIKKFEKLNRYVDSYMLLTEAMKDVVDVHGKRYMVVEGIVDTAELPADKDKVPSKTTEEKYIVYTGKLNAKFGVKHLVDAFMKLKNKDYRLILCGKGDAESYVCEKSQEDGRILYQGQVTPQVAKQWVTQADVLVNPRKNDEEYTKYSFPSKNIEYLLSGHPVVGYMLDGIPKVYENFMYMVQGDSDTDFAQAIECAMQSSVEGQKARYEGARQYFETLTSEAVARQLLHINKI